MILGLTERTFELVLKFKEELQEHYKMKDLGKLIYFLGIRFQQDQESGTITLSQGKYIQEKLEEFGFQDVKPVATPMEACHRTNHPNDTPLNALETKLFQSTLGLLLYLANGTRFDIAFVCNHFAQYMATPFVSH